MQARLQLMGQRGLKPQLFLPAEFLAARQAEAAGGGKRRWRRWRRGSGGAGAAAKQDMPPALDLVHSLGVACNANIASARPLLTTFVSLRALLGWRAGSSGSSGSGLGEDLPEGVFETLEVFTMEGRQLTSVSEMWGCLHVCTLIGTAAGVGCL